MEKRPKDVLQTSQRTSGGRRSRDVARVSFLNISSKRISMVIFSVLVHQICVLSTDKVLLHILSVLEKRHHKNVPKSSQKDPLSVTSLGRPQDVNLIIDHKIGS